MKPGMIYTRIVDLLPRWPFEFCKKLPFFDTVVKASYMLLAVFVLTMNAVCKVATVVERVASAEIRRDAGGFDLFGEGQDGENGPRVLTDDERCRHRRRTVSEGE